AGACAWSKASVQPRRMPAHVAAASRQPISDIVVSYSIEPPRTARVSASATASLATSRIQIPGDARVVDLRGVESAQILAGADRGLGVHPLHLPDAADANLRILPGPFEGVGPGFGRIIVEPALAKIAD